MLGLSKRRLPWMAGALAVLFAGLPGAASGKPVDAGAHLRAAADPPLTASVITYDFGFRDATKTEEDPTGKTVTIAPGGTVSFSYPTGSNSHNVVFGDGDTETPGPQPSSCVQTAGVVITTAPPLPSFSQPAGWAGSCTFNTPGTFKFYCQAHTTMQGTVIVEAAAANQPPTVTAGRTPTGNVDTGQNVSFTATASDPDNDTLTYEWDFGDGTAHSTSQNPTHAYATAGTYTAKVTVSDGKGGTDDDTLSITVVQPNRNPTVAAGRTPTGTVNTGQNVAFTATASDPDGDTLTYDWDFGDGTAHSTSQNPSHAYATAGTFSAKVTVSDGKGGTASDTLSITVTGGGSCPPGYRDDFNGTALDASWSVLRPDATDGGVVVGNGLVTLPTGVGDIYQDNNTATNLVMRPAPSGSFTVTAKINHHGNERYQQAGIMIYGDDDNYVKLDRTATNASGSTNTEFFEFIQEQNGTARNNNQDHTANIASDFPSDFYLRITWDGTNLTGAYSTDGTAWTNVGRASTAMPANPKVTFFALSNGAGTVLKPTFDWLTIDGPPCGVNQNPVISSATATPTSGIAPLPVTFAAAATDPDGDPLTYSWSFGDNTNGTGANPSHTYSAGGNVNAVLTVSDGNGGTATRTIPISVLAPDDANARFRALVFSKTAAFRHDSIPQGITAIRNLGTQNNFQVDATEDATLFRDDILSHYKTVIWLETTGDVLNDSQQAAFERFIRAGGGYVGIHSAADTEYGWPWYGELVGAYFRDHPNGTPNGTVVVEDTTDPSTQGLPARWARTDEWYNFQTYVNPVNGGGSSATPYNPRDNAALHILLTMDTSTYTGAAPAGDHPISWCHRFDGGRSWYTGMGHTQASYSEALFLGHILAGINITAGATPSAACGIAPGNRPPTVDASRDPSGNVTANTAIAFTATGSDPDGDTLTYTWDFGDSTPTSSSQNPTHTYTTAGNYAAKVTVDDGHGGTASATVNVTVVSPAALETSQDGDVTATVGSVLALSIAPNATLGAVTPGVTKDYNASVTALVTSTAGSAALSVSDAGPTAPGRLVNGAYALAQPLQVQASDATHPAGPFGPVGADPLTILTLDSAVSADAVTVGLKQSVGADELLRAGTYSKTLTFTLTSTTP